MAKSEPYEKTLIIGDVHGCVDELRELLKKCEHEETRDEVIFVGDLINKGPDSLGVLKLADSLGAKKVIGNHEMAFLKYVHSRKTSDHVKFPHWEKLIQDMGDDLDYWVQDIESWPAFIERENVIVVHGGLIPGRPPREEDREILIKIRTWDGKGVNLNNPEDPPWHQFYQGEKRVVYGHWAAQGLHTTEKTIGLDSGCVYGGELSAYLLESEKIVQVQAAETYAPIHPPPS